MRRIFVGVVLVLVAWTLAIPLVATPDAAQHVTYAASLWRGQLTSPDVTEEGGGVLAVRSVLRVPRAYAQTQDARNCFQRNPPADRSVCPFQFSDDTEMVEVRSNAGRYPPLYYLLVGAPSRLADAEAGVLGMRLLSALLNGSLLGGAFALARGRGRHTLVVLALTPQVAALTALVNPSGPELAGAVLLWVATLGVAEHVASRAPGPPSGGLWVGVAAGGFAVANARPLGPAIVLSIVGLALLPSWAGSWSTTVQGMRGATTSRAARQSLVVLVAGLLVALAWIMLRDPSAGVVGRPTPGLTPAFVARRILASTPVFVQSMVWFGPEVVWRTWAAVVSVGVAVALVRARWPHRLALFGTLGWALAVPILATIASAPRVGFVWQGRYGLPVVFGLVLVSSSVLSERLSERGEHLLRVVVVVGVALVGVLAVQEQVATRITFPVRPDVLFPTPVGDAWTPLLPPPAIVGLAAFGWLLTASALIERGRRPRTARPTMAD